MADSFWGTFYLFERDRQKIVKANADMCEDMRVLVAQTKRVISDSRELLDKVDEMLRRPPAL